MPVVIVVCVDIMVGNMRRVIVGGFEMRRRAVAHRRHARIMAVRFRPTWRTEEGEERQPKRIERSSVPTAIVASR